MEWRQDGLLASIVDSSSDAIIGIDADGVVTAWNRGAELIYGWTANEMLGHGLERIVPDDLRGEFDHLVQTFRGGGVIRDLLTRRQRKDGTLIDVSLSISPIRSEDGWVAGAVKTERDVTKRRRQDAIANGQRRLLESLARTGKLRAGLVALIQTIDEMTRGGVKAVVMRVDTDRRSLELAASGVPPGLEHALQDGLPLAPRGHPASEAAFSGQVVAVRDLRACDWDADAALEAGFLSCCSTPIVTPSGEVLGTLDIYDRTLGDPASDDLVLVSAFARTAALVIDRYQAFEAMRSGRAMLGALNKINALLATDLETNAILHRVAEEGTRIVTAEMGAFFHGPTGGGGFGFQTHVVAGSLKHAFSELATPRATPLLDQALSGRAPLRLDDVRRDPRFGKRAPHYGFPPRHPAVVSLLAAPVVTAGDELIGLLLFGHSAPRAFTRWHEKVLRGLVVQAALALDNARLYELARRRAQALAAVDKKKDEFLAMLGHELRNPLHAMSATTELLATSAAPDDVEQATQILRRQVRHMGRLVDDLLDIGRVTRGEVVLRPRVEDLRVPVRRAVESFRGAAQQVAVTLTHVEPDAPCWAEIDTTRIEQVVGNLIHNALKFAPGTVVVVELADEGSEFVLAVTDEGRGISSEELPGIFTHFASSRGTPSGGLGLGLGLVEHLVRVHGGSVHASSAGPGKGARFEARLPHARKAPAKPAPEPAAEPAAAEPDEGPRVAKHVKHVLLVEDLDDAAVAVRLVLERWGHRVSHASSGEEALALVSEDGPDAVLLDIGLPDVDGWQLAQMLRSRTRNPELRIAALTGRGQRRDHDRSKSAGIEMHFVKPVDPHRIRAWLAT
jgi:PAS domain S-box-containing protein